MSTTDNNAPTPEVEKLAEEITDAPGEEVLNQLAEETERLGLYYALPPAPDVQRVAEEICAATLPTSMIKSRWWQMHGASIASILTRFAAELTAKKDAEIARLNKACDAFSNAEILLSGDWKARAEKAEAELAEAKKWSDAKTKLGDDLLCEVRELRAYRERMEWLHRGNDKDAEGFEWGVFRVKWDAQGQPVSVLHTLTDLTDLDAAMGASRMPRYYDEIADLQAQLIKEQDYSLELKAERDQLRAEVDRLTTINGQYSGSIADLRAEVQAKQHAIDAATAQIAQLSAEVERLTKARNLDAEAMNLYAEQVSDLRAIGITRPKEGKS